MSSRHPNPRLAKIHRCYTVEEVSEVFSVHRNTVRSWVRQGLPTCDDRRPMLIRGADLVTFLRERRAKSKRPCASGELFCVRCRAPRVPAGKVVEYKALTPTSGNLVAICPDCDALMYRRVSLCRLQEVRGGLDLIESQGQPRISESADPSLSSDLA